MKRSIPVLITSAALLSLSFAGVAQADSQGPITFESYGLASVDGQSGWSSTGPYDQSVVTQSEFPSFGSQSLRISSAVTSGAFGDQTFSPGLANPVGEGTSMRHFDASFQIGTTQAGVQPGLHLNVSPDDGNGGRMSYLRFDDQADGVHVFFDDVTDAGPLGTVATFNESDIATLDRATAHTVRFSINVYPGPANDVVRIYIDGALAATGTTWEDYYRYDPEQFGNSNQVPVIDKLGLFERGDAATATAGGGFLVDNLALSSTADTAGCEFSTTDTTMTLVGDCTTDQTITIPAGFTLDGAGHKITAVDPTGGHFTGAIVQNTLGSAASVTNVDITASDLAVTCSVELFGVLLDGAPGTISDVTVHGIRQGTASGCQLGNAIVARNMANSSASFAVTIKNNTVFDYQKNGITAKGGVTASVTGNVVTGDGPIDYIAQNGIQISYGASALVSGNTVSGNWYTPKPYTACGLLFYQAGGVKQQANSLFSNEMNLCNAGRGGGNVTP